MKRKIFTLAAFLVMLVALLMLTSCTVWDAPYESLDKAGSSVSVKFQTGGGMFAGTNGVTVVDVFNVDNYEQDANGNVSITLIAPDSEARGNEALEISRNGHTFAGWYKVETVTNQNGEALDEDGNLASSSGKEPAKTYTKWDFAKDRLIVKADENRSGETPTLTLTAMWIPYTNFVFHDATDGTPVEIGAYQGTSLELPEWDMNTGKLNYKKFVPQSGKTLENVYLDAELTVPMTETLKGSAEFSGSENSEPQTINVYTTWRNGEWSKISTAAQLKKNMKASGCYEILADLDFSNEVWTSGSMTFSGQIIGNGHKISGIKTNAVITGKGDVSSGGVFGTLTDSAVITDVTFENVQYTVKSSLSKTARFGILAGKNEGATLSGVEITSSCITLTSSLTTDFSAKIKAGDFIFALAIADGDVSGVSVGSAVTVSIENTAISYTVDTNGIVTLSYPAA